VQKGGVWAQEKGGAKVGKGADKGGHRKRQLEKEV
jgi:hypothetical protein